MRSDDELLSHIRQQAGVRRQRRQRALAAGATAAVVLLLGAGALAATGGDDHEGVTADGSGSTTTSTTSTTTTGVPTTPTTSSTTTSTTSTTTTPPVETTTTTEPPPATTEAPPTTTTPPAQPSATGAGDGITVEATATAVDGGRVTLSIRIRADHGSHPGGSVGWGPSDSVLYGLFAELGPTSCDDMIDDDPTTNPGPDPGAGPVDETFTVVIEVQQTAAQVTLEIEGTTSWCSSDVASAGLTLVVPLR